MNAVSPELDRRFRDAAAQEKLLDVAYDLVDSPVGRLLVAATERGLCRIAYDAEPEQELERLARAFGVRVLRSSKPIDAARRELDEYFEGSRRRFDLPVDVALLADFNRRVLGELARVPYGEVVTYGELAARAARPRAARAVGTVMNRNPLPIVLPCHRVIGANGKLVGYAGGLESKEQLLRLEGAMLYGQRGGRGSARSASRQSSRVGAKTSMTTAPSGPTRTSCGTPPGMHHVSPAPSSRDSSPTRKTSDPFRQIPSCSLSWLCSGTMLPASSSITPSVIRSPCTIRPCTPSQMRWRSREETFPNALIAREPSRRASGSPHPIRSGRTVPVPPPRASSADATRVSPVFSYVQAI
jgi:methylated-DNA-[protein]-cysteine S-methyltransferase